ncbi:MAG: elongation factor Ts [Oceanospirillaceae bacterium]|jgi:elongation factor Ts|uniref:translation elongation factor Ts n=1 Tax=unclassified Thalassolituus TaxID=2624967 RepID=UPI000C3A1F7C|nr:MULTISPECIES: translation elongation factor Ts [unclassified Thalassolituus]MAG42681.1 elongation factor Ts [Oceanospirillaceae bacterium]MEC8907959.1 translation elongation factor Ts [Pseudomonadota bacterium]HCG79588.1 elongation factor Ts [Oceanospirillales bacterium]MEC9410828.1 translation elongation factor Ts [Pseudomonadota bacterium]MED5441782.1 translation elongation factor Ts [Pseudomonadota bacterium]|tara:strand:- start:227 stop:1081 length:855 start_codon:yes stop_codon:yes gene_type:complete
MATVSAAQVKELRERTGLGMMECKKALTAAGGDIDQAIEDLRKNSGLKAAKKADRTAAEGKLRVVVGEGNAVIVEINSETDFAAGDANFAAFADKVVAKLAETKEADVAALMAGELEDAREALVQKIGENITVRRPAIVEADTVGAYVHSNGKIACIVALNGGNEELAKDIAMHVTASNPRVVRGEDMPADVLEKEKEIIKAQPDMAGKPDEIVEKMMGGRIKKFLKENSLLEQPFVKNPDLTVGQLAKEGGAEVISFLRMEVGEGIEVEETDFAAEVAAQLKG